MAVDQAKYMNFFSNNNNNQFYNNNNNNFIPQTNDVVSNSLLLQPMYGLNDAVAYNNNNNMAVKQLTTTAVKDDSGITFNNSLIPPPPPSTRKRSRDAVPGSVLDMNPVSVSVPPCKRSSRSSVNFVVKGTNNDVEVNNDNNNNNNGVGFGFLGQDLSLQIMQQDLEFDRLISNHMERMKVEIEERKKQQLTRIISAMGESLGRRLRDKEEQLTKLSRINYALDEKVKSLCVENQIWRDLAQTNEATANALRTNLEQLLHQQQVNDNAAVADDAASCCGSSSPEDAAEEVRPSLENGWIYRGKNDNGNNKKGESGCSSGNSSGSGRMCRKCGEGESSVLLLPCRHLCLCTACGPAVNACPICDTVKNASVHVNLS